MQKCKKSKNAKKKAEMQKKAKNVCSISKTTPDNKNKKMAKMHVQFENSCKKACSISKLIHKKQKLKNKEITFRFRFFAFVPLCLFLHFQLQNL